MTAHELARLLLSGPDVLVLKRSSEGLDEISTVDKQVAYRWHNHPTWFIEYFPELPEDLESNEQRQAVVTL